MNPTRKLLAVAAAALGAAAVAAPVSSATAAAGTGVAPSLVAAPVYVITLAGPSEGQTATVVGPSVTTTAPSSFINSNTQISAGVAVSGVQAIP